MPDDEQLIRSVFTAWQEAAKTGDLPRLLSLMDEDVVFLRQGQPPMRGRNAFATAFQAGLGRQRIESTLETEEMRIVSDFAFCRNHLTVTVTPLPAGPPRRLTGYTLTILRKQPGGAWVLARDANMLAPEPA